MIYIAQTDPRGTTVHAQCGERNLQDCACTRDKLNSYSSYRASPLFKESGVMLCNQQFLPSKKCSYIYNKIETNVIGLCSNGISRNGMKMIIYALKSS